MSTRGGSMGRSRSRVPLILGMYSIMTSLSWMHAFLLNFALKYLWWSHNWCQQYQLISLVSEDIIISNVIMWYKFHDMLNCHNEPMIIRTRFIWVNIFSYSIYICFVSSRCFVIEEAMTDIKLLFHVSSCSLSPVHSMEIGQSWCLKWAKFLIEPRLSCDDSLSP